MTKADYARYDLIIGMDRSNMRGMQRICGGDPDGKLSLLLDWTDSPRDVDDPWYSDDFKAAESDIAAGCTSLLETLRSSVGNGV